MKKCKTQDGEKICKIPKSSLRVVEKTWAITEWSGEEDRVIRLKENKEDIDVWISPPDRVRRREVSPIGVLFGGALDFEGNKKEFLKRYPDIYAKLKQEGEI